MLEFHGPTIDDLPTSGRLVICNMSVEAGATAGIVPADRETERYLRSETGVTAPVDLAGPDVDADYAGEIDVDVSDLPPQIACPHAVDNVKPVETVAGVAVDQIVVGSCTNGRLDDLETVARFLAGRKVARGVRLRPITHRVWKPCGLTSPVSTS